MAVCEKQKNPVAKITPEDNHRKTAGISQQLMPACLYTNNHIGSDFYFYNKKAAVPIRTTALV